MLIIETYLQPAYPIDNRVTSDLIVFHHTGSVFDTDKSAAQIDSEHKRDNNWAMIGYHFVIRKNGDIERGRPINKVGAHTFGFNSHSIGIHLSGDFNAAHPTDKQIESSRSLLDFLCTTFNIPRDRQHIKGHGELDPSVTIPGCPGINLFNRLDSIVYPPDVIDSAPPSPPTANFIIVSGSPISDNTVKRVKDILVESNCPNESLRNSIAGAYLNGNVIHIGSGSDYKVFI